MFNEQFTALSDLRGRNNYTVRLCEKYFRKTIISIGVLPNKNIECVYNNMPTRVIICVGKQRIGSTRCYFDLQPLLTIMYLLHGSWCLSFMNDDVHNYIGLLNTHCHV